jgi:hypothetical protein
MTSRRTSSTFWAAPGATHSSAASTQTGSRSVVDATAWQRLPEITGRPVSTISRYARALQPEHRTVGRHTSREIRALARRTIERAGCLYGSRRGGATYARTTRSAPVRPPRCADPGMTKASAVPSCSGSRWDRGHPPDPHTTRRRVRNGRFPSRPGSAYMGTFTPEPVPMPGVRVHGAGRGPRLPL